MFKNQSFPFNGTGDDGRPSFNPNRFRKANGDDTQAPILLGLGGSLLLIAIILLVARLWSRFKPVWKLHADDWTALAATTGAIAQYILLSVSCKNGLGRHGRFIPFFRRMTSLRLLFITQVIWYWSITLVKLSVAFLLLRVRSTLRWKIFLYTIMVILVLAAIVSTCFQFLQCRPFSVYWDPRVFRNGGGVQCFRRSVINGNIVAFSTIQVISDLVFSLTPITFIRKLNRPRREKIFLSMLMGLGLFAAFAAILRTVTLKSFYTTTDPFRRNVTVTMWAVLEQQFALIAATIPTLKAFIERALQKVGLLFYDEQMESQVRDRLVQFGLLGLDEAREERRPSRLGADGAQIGSPKMRERRPVSSDSVDSMEWVDFMEKEKSEALHVV